MGDSNKSKRGEAREFWEAAIRLWSDSDLSVREFCRREGLAEHTFYSWRRELLPEGQESEVGQEASAAGDRVAGAGRRRRQRKQVAASDKSEESADKSEASVATPFIELVSPASDGACQCTLELENSDGAKMRIELRSIAMPDLAAISRSFWNPTP